MLTDNSARLLFGNTWEEEAQRMFSLFRTSCDIYGDDPMLWKVVDKLRKESRQFEMWWQQHDIGTPLSGRKLLHHPSRGDLTVLFSTFQSNDDPQLRLALYLEEPL